MGGGFPNRFVGVRSPDYPDLAFRILANPDGKLYGDLLEGDLEDNRDRLGAALVAAYGGVIVEGYGVWLDFSTPETACAIFTDDAIPIDLKAWIRNAPLELIEHERGERQKKFPMSFGNGN